MRDDICTIPVSEVFEEQNGCPICRMINTVNERILNYILGDAMMEPDVRIETNKQGFCSDHYAEMLSRRGRLQFALMLETHLKSIDQEVFAKKLFNSNQKKKDKAKSVNDSCFVCNKRDWGISRMIETIYRCYENESDFRELFNAQPQFCLPHYELLMSGIDKRKCPRHGSEMADNLTKITGEYARSLGSDVSKYCSMYDYRAKQSSDMGDVKEAVENAVAFLSGKCID